MYRLRYSSLAKKDAKKVAQSSFKQRCFDLLDIISKNPYQNPPPYEMLAGDLEGKLSRRLNIQHRLIYEIDKEAKIIKILRMWSHYE